MTVLVRKWVLRLAFMVCSVLPVRERVVLASNHSSQPAGNLKCIHDEMQRQGLGSQVGPAALRYAAAGFSARRRRCSRRSSPSTTSRPRASSSSTTTSSRSTSSRPSPRRPSSRRGTRAARSRRSATAFSTSRSARAKSSVRHVRIHSNYDHILIGSKNAIPAYSEAFGQPAEKFVTELGIPRTDLFFDDASGWRQRGADRAREVRDPGRQEGHPLRADLPRRRQARGRLPRRPGPGAHARTLRRRWVRPPAAAAPLRREPHRAAARARRLRLRRVRPSGLQRTHARRATC